MANRNLRQIQGQRIGRLSQPNIDVGFGGKITQYASAFVFVIALMSLLANEAFPQQTSHRSYKSNAVTNEAARLTASVYELIPPLMERDTGVKKPDGYDLLNYKIAPDGFQAAAYVNESTKQVFVVYAGTNDDVGDLVAVTGGKDWKGNLELGRETLVGSTSSPTLDSQTGQAMSFFEESKAKAAAAGTTDIVVAGQSQGGYHAQLVGAKYDVMTRTFNAPGVPQSALERFGIEVKSSLDIVNFVRGSDPAGNLGDHLGQRVTCPDHNIPNSQYVPAGLLDNHSSKAFATDLPSMNCVITTDQQLEELRADKVEFQDKLRNLPSDNPFEKLIDTSSWDKRVSDYKREATAEIGDASRRIDQKWGQTRQDLARQLDQVRKNYGGSGDAMAGAAGSGAFPSVNPPLGTGSQPTLSQPSRSQPAPSQPTTAATLRCRQVPIVKSMSSCTGRHCDAEVPSRIVGYRTECS